MTLTLSMPGQEELKPRITVFGVGGAGGNAVDNMIEKALDGVDFVVANTDAQALQNSSAQSRIQLGVKVTEGLGAGAKASIGAAAAEESIEQIVDHLAGAHMCFITAGMGGGTGTGAAPIIAQAARELGVLTVGVVTKPFQFEGAKRMRQAEDGVEALQKMVDTLIIIPNQNLFRLANEKTTFTEAFSMADDVLYQGVKGVTDLMVRPGLINLDFADVRAVMDEMGKAMMGTGEAEGEERAVQAAEKAIANPLLDEISLRGAKGVLINITGGHDLTLFELDEAANRIREEVDPDANIIVGSTLDDGMEGKMRVSVVATGIDASEVPMDIPVPRRKLSEPLRPTQAAPETQPEPQQQPAYQPQQHVAEAAPEQASFDGFEGHRDNGALTEDIFSEEDVAPAPAPAPRAAPAPRPAPMQRAQPPAPAEEHYEDDDLPPPAYVPRSVEQRATRFEEPAPEEAYVAPQRPRPGQPSPEALARLQAAVNKAPRSAGAGAPSRHQPQQQPAAQHHDTEKSRFGGINSLINRMTGQAEADQRPQQAQPTAPQPQARTQPPVRGFGAAPSRVEPEEDPDQERIEIPAFLRRQAN
ncbi:cell division protein FtsZ [Pseudooceanicola aestuarii]|uniref:cell division protein FtsZ n=1 Tax=Pseudooceanicola aestuarii TaxID=2697319 RepID=UPI0013D1356D|nr:cell division protein FtsZ [Pseudooceanicola aestuarii]